MVIMVGSSKKRHGEVLLGRDRKKLKKMDNGVRTDCGKILRTLMRHKFGGVFNHVQLGLPDYFDVISHPMDFGTILNKLEKDVYSSKEAFAADVRLTFANAMRYNPPSNFVHTMAKELKDLFETTWKLFEVKLRKSIAVAEHGTLVKKNPLDASKIANAKTLQVKKPAPSLILKFKKADDSSTVNIKPLVSREEKIDLRSKFISAMRGAWSRPLRCFLKKHDLIHSNRELILSTFNSFNDDALLELSRVLNVSFGTSTEKAKEDHGNAQRTMEITERKKLEESNIESRIRAVRAAKKALLEIAKSDIQLRRDKEREKIEKMERSVIIDEDNLTFLKELEKLCQYSGIQNPMEKIGLRLKEDCCYGYEDSNDDNGIISDELEDGEICDY